MKEPGFIKVKESQLNGQWEAAIQRENIDDIPSDLKNALRRKKGAIAKYHALKTSRKKQLLYWLGSAKQEKTRKNRINIILDEL